MINRVHRLLRVLAAWVLCFACQAQPALPGTVSSGTPNGLPTLRVVGGLSDLYQYTRLEEPFWTTRLTQLSHGKYHADIVPFDRAGIPGQDMLRLMELGVLPFGTALLSNVAAQRVMSLPMSADMSDAEQRQVVQALVAALVQA